MLPSLNLYGRKAGLVSGNSEESRVELRVATLDTSTPILVLHRELLWDEIFGRPIGDPCCQLKELELYNQKTPKVPLFLGQKECNQT